MIKHYQTVLSNKYERSDHCKITLSVILSVYTTYICLSVRYDYYYDAFYKRILHIAEDTNGLDNSLEEEEWEEEEEEEDKHLWREMYAGMEGKSRLYTTAGSIENI